MKKIFIILFFSFIYFNSVFWLDDTQIIKIWYTWNLSNDTIVTLTWKWFDLCESLSIDSKKIPISTQNSTTITFKFSDLLVYSWKLNLNCSLKNYSFQFNFPYIEKWVYDINNNLREVELIWLNFNGWNVVSKWWTFKTNFIGWTMAEGTLAETTNSDEIYITVWWLSSNLIKLGLETPKIDFVYSENWLFEWEDIYIYGKNLDFYKNSKLYLWDKNISDFKVLENWNIIKFNSLWYQWNFDVYIISNGFKSNILKIFIYWKKPVISNVMEKYNEESGTQLYVYWTWFSRDLVKTEVFINWKKAAIKDIKEDYILITQYSLIPWNNYVTISSNWYFSNAGNYFYKNWSLPEITTIDVENSEEWKRSIKIYMNWYVSTTDKILFNWSPVIPIACAAWMCRIEIDKKILKWDFRVSRWEYKSKNIISFDLTEKYQPYVEYIRIRETLEKWSRIEIYWKNFFDSTISSSNLFSKDDKWAIEIEVSDWLIKWKIANDYNISSNSSITISKYWLNYTFTFGKTNFKDWYIYATPFIIGLKSNDYILKEWSIVTLNWIWFKAWDVVNIWWQKTTLDIKTNTFVIPTWITKWAWTLFIESEDKLKSNNYKVFLYWYDSEKTIKVDYKDLWELNYDVNKWYNLKDVVYKAEINSNLDDLIINKVKFNISWLNEKWLFSLYLDWTFIWDAFLSQDWTLIFDNNFIINKLSWVKTLYLYSKSSTTTDWTYNVLLSLIEWKYVNYTELKPEFSLSLLSSKVNFKKSNISKCIDSDAQKLNCNSFLQWKYITSTQTKTEIKAETPSVIVKSPVTNTTSNYFEITTSGEEIIDKITSSKVELSLSSKWKKYISQLDVLLPKIPKDNQYKLLKKIYILNDKLSASTSSKNAETIRLLNYMEAKLEYELTK